MINLFKRLIIESQTFAIISVFLSFFYPLCSYSSEINVLLIPSSDSYIYTKTIDSIKNTLKSNNNSIIFNTVSLDKLKSTELLSTSKTDIYVPVGKNAFDYVIKIIHDRPILPTLITRFDFQQTINKVANTDNNKIGAIFIDQPLTRYFSFARLALPNNKRFGFLISNEYRRIIPEFKSAIKDYSYYLFIHNNNKNLISSLTDVIDNSDVIIALPDPVIFNRKNTYNILLSTYRRLIPIIGFSDSYVSAGALAGIYATPELIGKQTGEVIYEISKQKIIDKLPRLPAKYFEISVNNKVSRSLGIPQLDTDNLINALKKIEASVDE